MRIIRCFGKNHTKETCERISETRSKKWISGEYPNIWQTGKVFSNKMRKEMSYRSSWEREFIDYLDNNNKISSFYVESITIKYHYDQIRHYIPDFLVEYVDGKKEIIEIKPSCFLEHKINKLKFAAARKYCEENNMKFRVLTEKYLYYIGCNI